MSPAGRAARTGRLLLVGLLLGLAPTVSATGAMTFLAASGDPPTVPEPPETSQTPPTEPTILGAPSTFEIVPDTDALLALQPGAELREEPDLSLSPFSRVDAPVEVEVLDRSGAWLRVRYAGRKGWLLDPDAIGTRADGDAARETASASLEKNLALARELFRDPPTRRQTGPFLVLSDAKRERWPERAAVLAGALEATYRQRYGLTAPRAAAPPEMALILFARTEEFERFRRAAPAFGGAGADLGLAAHSTLALASLALEDRSQAETERLIVHELTHLLNQRYLGTHLPIWLEEGLAEDLASHRFDAQGALRLGSLSGEERLIREAGGAEDVPIDVKTRLRTGARASLARLASEGGRRPGAGLDRLLRLGPAEFFDPEGRAERYALAGFFLRFLLDPEQAPLGDRLRAFLSAAADDDLLTAEALEWQLERTIEELDDALRSWIHRLAEREL